MSYTKDSYYFSHDTNARHDPKCSALISEYGTEGYGVFWIMIEILAEQEGYKLKKFNKLYDGLARQMGIDIEQTRSMVEALIHDYELLDQDDKFIWSNSLIRRMEIKNAKRQAKVEAGRKGGIQSGITRSARSKTKQNEAMLEANEPKESKVKESKVKESKVKESKEGTPPKKKYAEFVSMTKEEYKKLVDKHGEVATKKMIDILNNHKGATGKTYNSDYHAILSWVINRYEEDKKKEEPPYPYKPFTYDDEPKEPKTFWDNNVTDRRLEEEKRKRQINEDTTDSEQEEETFRPDIDNIMSETLKKMSNLPKKERKC